MIHHRIIPKSKTLKKTDYRFGFGMDYSFYMKLDAARVKYNETHSDKLPVRADFKDDYDLRTGFSIDGRAFNTRPHPILGRTIKHIKSGETYIVEGIYKHFEFGYYWTVLMRREGTKSHGTLYWENINCKDPTIVKLIKSSQKNWIFV